MRCRFASTVAASQPVAPARKRCNVGLPRSHMVLFLLAFGVPHLTMTKWRLLLVAFALVIAVPFVVQAMLPSGPGITKANYDRIQDGMTFDEVRAFLGGPDSFTDPSIEGSARRGELLWVNDDKSGAAVSFDENGKVFDKWWADSSEGLGEKLCRWIRWPWW